MPSRSFTHRIAIVATLAASTVLVSGGSCMKRLLKHGGSADATPTAKALPTVKRGPKVPNIDYASVRPNELGRIPVIMYHEIQIKPGKKNSLVRTVDDFKADLQTMYDAGFRPVNLSDVVDNKIDLPAGKMPVVLTFDDARASQFKLVETPSALKIDPNCAMGILDDFHKAHADWPMRATFFVLPQSKVTLQPFGQSGMGDEKLDYIVANGMEIGNHTTFHKSLRDMTPEQIQAELGNANNVLSAAVPKASIETMAVPMGKFPHNKAYWKYLMDGTYDGKPYHYKAVMDAAWRPMPAPDSKDYKPARLERIDGTADGLNGVRYWLKKLSDRDGIQPYVSDGDPNVISFPKGEATTANLAKIASEGKVANPYSPFGGPGGSKPIEVAGPGDFPASPGAAVPTAAAGPKPIIGEAPAAPVASPAGAAASPAPAVPATTVTEPVAPPASAPAAPVAPAASPAGAPAAPSGPKPITGN